MGKGGHRGGGSRSSSSSSSSYRSSSSSSFGRSSHYHSYYGGSRSSNNCDCDPQGGACKGICDTFCLPSSFCAMAWLVLIIPMIFLGAFTLLMDSDIVMDLNETQIYHANGAPQFVSSYEIRDFSGEIDVFYVQNPVLESKPSGDPLNLSESILVPRDEYIDYAYWLNEGSTVDISFTAKENWQKEGKESSGSSSSVDFYVVKGDSDFNSFTSTWKRGGSSYNYMIYRHSNNDVEIKLHLDVVSADIYYLMFVNEFASNVNVDIKVTISKTHYLLDEVTPICGPGAVKVGVVKTSTCEIPLVSDESWQVLLRSPFIADSPNPNSVNKDTDSSAGAASVPKKAAEVTYQLKVSTSIRWSGYLYSVLEWVVGIFAFSWVCHRIMVCRKGLTAVDPFWGGTSASNHNNNSYEPISGATTHSLDMELGAIVETASVEPVPVAEVVSTYTDSSSSDNNATNALASLWVDPTRHFVEPSAPPSTKM